MAKYSFIQAVKYLSESSANISCKDLCRLLTDLGFVVKRGSSGCHYTFSHPKIDGFYGGNFNCGHGATMLPVYPRNVLRTLKDLQVELEEMENEYLKTI